jgi:hypothetical protein
MGKLFDKFKKKAEDKIVKMKSPNEQVNKQRFKEQKEPQSDYENIPEMEDIDNIDPNQDPEVYTDPETGEQFSVGDDMNPRQDFYNEPMNLYPSQKPESFHFFILENQYQDLERAIRGVKDVWDKDKNAFVIKRKSEHCFTDEESEDIVRTAQTHLSSDIKLAIFNLNEYPILLDGIYQQLWIMFKEIMDYRFGRFGNVTKQARMKQQAMNIFNMLMMRIKANYSRAVGGAENKATHDSVKGQESLQQTERRYRGDAGRFYT